jgi:hypothetical protein
MKSTRKSDGDISGDLLRRTAICVGLTGLNTEDTLIYPWSWVSLKTCMTSNRAYIKLRVRYINRIAPVLDEVKFLVVSYT